MKDKSKDFKVPALEKGLNILETLSASDDPMSLTDLCQALGRSASELYRMIGFLEDRGYIVRESHSGNYRLSLKLYELAHMHSPVERLINAAAAPMRELSLSVRQSCHLSVLNHPDLVVLYQQESPEKIRFSIEVGARFDPLATVSGRLLLAHLPEEQRLEYVRDHPLYLSWGEEERRRLDDKLAEILSLGYSFADQETHQGITDTAVAVGNSRIGMAAALAVPCLTTSKRQPKADDSLLKALMKCAEQITSVMGVSHV